MSTFDLDVEQLKRWYCDEGLSTIQIAQRVGCSNVTIGNYLRRYGIPARPKGGGSPPAVHGGERYGRLTVIDQAGMTKRGRAYKCRCDCGNEKAVVAADLRGGTRSCGCLVAESSRAIGKRTRTTHGMSKTGTFRSWQSMWQRCTNAKTMCWHLYGGRGIKVCDRWKTFENFVADVGVRPKGTSLDRINTDGHYEPGNCKWSTPKEQAANRRKITAHAPA